LVVEVFNEGLEGGGGKACGLACVEAAFHGDQDVALVGFEDAKGPDEDAGSVRGLMNFRVSGHVFLLS